MKKVIYLVFAFTCITCYCQKNPYHDYKFVSIDYADSDSLSLRSKNITKILFDLINEYRKENGLSELIIDAKGNSACELHNKYMFEKYSKTDIIDNILRNSDNDGIAHNEYNKKNKFYRGKEAWHRYSKARAEIIAASYGNVYHPKTDPYSMMSDLEIAKRFLNRWKTSSGHNRIILTPEYNYVSGYANLFIIYSHCKANETFPNKYENRRYATCTFYE